MGSRVYETIKAAHAGIDQATTEQDLATTNLHALLAELQVRVTADDLAEGELESLVADAAALALRVSNNATSISTAATAVAAIEAEEPDEVPPIEEIPPIEEPPVE